MNVRYIQNKLYFVYKSVSILNSKVDGHQTVECNVEINSNQEDLALEKQTDQTEV